MIPDLSRGLAPGWRRGVVVVLVAGICFSAAHARPAATPDPILILISIDGFRWDYMDRQPAANLRALASHGVRVRELIPSFPVLTFPNHYTIVTGLYPDHHGIVANTMLDPGDPSRFSMSSPTSRESRWWGGEPVWVTAVRAGRRAASLFWPGGESEIGGVRPTYWEKYDASMNAESRVAKVVDWLALPDDRRPSFIALYFEDVDRAGHDYGPETPEVAAAVARVDRAFATLVAAITRLDLDARTTIVVVSDHGMTTLSSERVIWLDDYVDASALDITETEGVLALTAKSGNVAAVYARLRSAHLHLRVFTRDSLPARFHYGRNPRVPAVIGIPDDGWVVTTRERRRRLEEDGKTPQRGTHGYDPANARMHAIFVAAGPPVRAGIVVPTMENVHIYDFLCAVLKLSPASNDGNAAMTRRFLR